MLARLSNTTVKAMGFSFTQTRASITTTSSTVHSSTSDELVIDLDFLQLMRPMQDLTRLFHGCGKALAPVWNNIQDTISSDVERMALLLWELEEGYDPGEVDSVLNDPAEHEHDLHATHLPNTRKSPTYRLYGERPPRIQRNSSYTTQPKIIPNPDPSIPTIIITPCLDFESSTSESESETSHCHVPIQDSAFNTRLTVPDHYPTFNQIFPPMLPLIPAPFRNGDVELTKLEWRWHEGHWEAVVPELEEQVRLGLFSRGVKVRTRARRRVGNGSGNGSDGAVKSMRGLTIQRQRQRSSRPGTVPYAVT
ncbi:hypothetical protein E1B28_000136 [Marasmius oreades]|uniref:Uncharacterized protein n=1 Tax=Marasmius oreades TaxID=181124 RepID=A0A9P7V0Q7_9AGAR|nr:uncharacterized protein E1B28_000136 [Marasmius oreades]KAG7098168.1 hypothetical protein E1B28_000136 [Marasmius oreades]